MVRYPCCEHCESDPEHLAAEFEFDTHDSPCCVGGCPGEKQVTDD